MLEPRDRARCPTGRGACCSDASLLVGRRRAAGQRRSSSSPCRSPPAGGAAGRRAGAPALLLAWACGDGGRTARRRCPCSGGYARPAALPLAARCSSPPGALVERRRYPRRGPGSSPSARCPPSPPPRPPCSWARGVVAGPRHPRREPRSPPPRPRRRQGRQRVGTATWLLSRLGNYHRARASASCSTGCPGRRRPGGVGGGNHHGRLLRDRGRGHPAGALALGRSGEAPSLTPGWACSWSEPGPGDAAARRRRRASSPAPSLLGPALAAVQNGLLASSLTAVQARARRAGGGPAPRRRRPALAAFNIAAVGTPACAGTSLLACGGPLRAHPRCCSGGPPPRRGGAADAASRGRLPPQP